MAKPNTWSHQPLESQTWCCFCVYYESIHGFYSWETLICRHAPCVIKIDRNNIGEGKTETPDHTSSIFLSTHTCGTKQLHKHIHRPPPLKFGQTHSHSPRGSSGKSPQEQTVHITAVLIFFLWASSSSKFKNARNSPAHFFFPVLGDHTPLMHCTSEWWNPN